jgi:hypothetical protein
MKTVFCGDFDLQFQTIIYDLNIRRIIDQDSNPWSTVLQASTLTITAPMRFTNDTCPWGFLVSTIINVCNLFAPIVGPLIGIINILILILYSWNNKIFKVRQLVLVLFWFQEHFFIYLFWSIYKTDNLLFIKDIYL